jgi:hypothetical protein
LKDKALLSLKAIKRRFDQGCCFGAVFFCIKVLGCGGEEGHDDYGRGAVIILPASVKCGFEINSFWDE